MGKDRGVDISGTLLTVHPTASDSSRNIYVSGEVYKRNLSLLFTVLVRSSGLPFGILTVSPVVTTASDKRCSMERELNCTNEGFQYEFMMQKKLADAQCLLTPVA